MSKTGAEPTSQSPDISWQMFAGNVIGMVVVAYLTSPLRNHPNFLNVLLGRLEAAVAVGAVLAGVFYLFNYIFNRKKERHLKRSFIIAAWVFLGLIIYAERGGPDVGIAEIGAAIMRELLASPVP